MEYKVFAKQLLEDNGHWAISLVNELYEKRGDAYLQAGRYRNGVRDFNRIFKGIPNFANVTDRWRIIATTNSGDAYYLDVKTAGFQSAGFASLWIKMVRKNGSNTTAQEIDCGTRRIRQISIISYDADGNTVSSSNVNGGWQPVVPDTIGEQLFTGACTQ